MPHGTSSITLVMVNDQNNNGLPNFGDSISFNVSTDETTEPTFVQAYGYQAGQLVWSGLWPLTNPLTLSSQLYQGGAMDGVAELRYNSGKKVVTLATLEFAVGG